ncbi:MAG: hypothetical protein A2W09_03820 [Deltaproteobacteria bacterium RBG_16_50_11]|nr:MAG: hypothetical protein A2W09_03820 [Deltaproteobacteria bacterium RBG_16_50_11]
MAKSKPINLQVSDIIQWFKKDELVINETFQRHAVWTPQAKTFFIDTILHELPLPKIYLRTILDPKHQTSIREVVDGQQRIRTIVEFASNKLKLSKRSEDFQGKRYDDLDDETKELFLGYTLTVEQLINATDDDVIDIFARLNSYTVTLNFAEKRHAEFQSEFKFAVRKASTRFRPFIEKYKVFSTKQRFRMADDEFMAEVFGVILQGVTDGGAPRISKLYKTQDDDTFTDSVSKEVRKKITFAFDFLENEMAEALSGMFSKHYHLLMIIAAICHHKYGIPKGQIDVLPERRNLASKETILSRLAELERAFEVDNPPAKYKSFIEASSGATPRIASRKVRFKMFASIFAE